MNTKTIGRRTTSVIGQLEILISFTAKVINKKSLIKTVPSPLLRVSFTALKQRYNNLVQIYSKTTICLPCY